ncbi:MAG: hypothetical protein LC655_01575 [Bacteroidales bacterium]|nr:hypothetical protein [Bacteroidales bacterium]
MARPRANAGMYTMPLSDRAWSRVFADATAAMFRLNLDQMAGAGDAVFGAQVGDGYGIWVSFH